MIANKDIHTFYKNDRVLLRSNDFIYLLPHPSLRDWISNYTVTFPNKDIISGSYSVIPHGSATLVFSCNKKGLYSELFGPSTIPRMVGSHANQYELLLIIEFQPAGLYTFTGSYQKELTDHIIPFELINLTLNKIITQMLISSYTMDDLVDNLDRVFLLNIHAACPSELKLASKMILDHIGNISHKELSGSIYYSERHLTRIFDQYFGMNSKTFSRLVRINKAIRLMQTPRNSVTFVSDVTGFYDLSHFIRDFKSVCGMTPKEYRNNMSDFYSELAKF